MLLFLVGLALLVGGYLLYGGHLNRLLQPDLAAVTPAVRLQDGMDYVPMPTWRIYLIQLLNIAGLGPVFGPIMGALWGPRVFLWIVLGCIFGGAAHDLVTGTMSVRNNGAGLPDLIGHYLGRTARHAATLFILVLMVLVGTVFVKGPALLLVSLLPAETVGGWIGPGFVEWLTSDARGQSVWLWVVMGLVFLYYVLATMLPIDKLIGRIYPLFALALLGMAVGLGASILTGRIPQVEWTTANLHPNALPAWPLIFITVSCGAISGFHATQSPLMARCLKSERHMRTVFYGAMIAEGIIAFVWAYAAQGYYGGVEGLSAALGPGLNRTNEVVHTISMGAMGTVGGALAILGVVVLPITSGDTAFRAGRLIAADYLKLTQKRVRNRYLIALPMFGLSMVLMVVPFGIIWRYFGWANQTLAAISLWAATVYLARRRSRYWLTLVPAQFMTTMTIAYILVEKRQNGCLGLEVWLGTTLALAVALAATILFFWKLRTLGPEDGRKALEVEPSAFERTIDTLAC
ncbi:MAG: carbon starvation protein A [Deltaproteobacteria bacterium]|nr:carbon starvation protein A [Deltaproteobacteria bacterium]